jgi:hypothetical protein
MSLTDQLRFVDTLAWQRMYNATTAMDSGGALAFRLATEEIRPSPRGTGHWMLPTR